MNLDDITEAYVVHWTRQTGNTVWLVQHLRAQAKMPLRKLLIDILTGKLKVKLDQKHAPVPTPLRARQLVENLMHSEGCDERKAIRIAAKIYGVSPRQFKRWRDEPTRQRYQRQA